jgi:Uma2 family endonuclease
MNAITSVPLDEYLATSYRPDCEYLDGELVLRNAGERDHSRLQHFLERYLGNREIEWGIVVLPEQRVQVKPTRYRVPDIAVFSPPIPKIRSSELHRSSASKCSRHATP